MLSTRTVLAVLLLFTLDSSAQEPPRSAPGGGDNGEPLPQPELEIKKVGETLFRLDRIEFDAKTREIRVPVTVNFREGGPVEYLLVHETGKVHESIFVTTVSPLHLEIVLRLLRYTAGNGDVFDAFLPEAERATRGGRKEDRGEAADFFFQTGEADPVPAHELVIDAETAGPMTPAGWVHTGSRVEGGSFLAESEGSIIAIYLDPSAIFNMTREGADVDERWGARHTVIPELGTPGTLLIRPGGNPVTKSE